MIKSRMVIFRLTQAEYEALAEACASDGRSVSEFTRAQVLASLQADERQVMQSNISEVNQKLSALQSAVDALQRKLDGMSSEPENSDGKLEPGLPGRER